ncbi:MAG TPA: type II toxin-antitoxin system Phd/YefM family antitoxin [Thermoleophilia bacterium]|nr:type II toxin-antitoxin system Phd/YefM family antitoxin [Thermoleophilia bacterium]
MGRQYSIAEARNHLSEAVHQAEVEGPITLTRRGRSVAVLIAEGDYRRLQAARPGFWDAAAAFRGSVDVADLAGPEVYENIRDRSPGRGLGA